MDIVGLLSKQENKENLDHELYKVLENINDLRTDEGEARKITIEISLLKNHYGEIMAGVQVKSKLCPRKGTVQTMMQATALVDPEISSEIKRMEEQAAIQSADVPTMLFGAKEK